MMNDARFQVGLQGLGIAEQAYQGSLAYARERLQSRGLAGAQHPDKVADPIIVHPDVRRMLLNIRAMTEAGRALAMLTGKQLDLAKFAEDEAVKAKASRYVGLLTPVAKAFLTDRGLDATILAQQVFGGHGYIRETGIEQLVRDTRIAQIYEGTNGIQAIDFLGRKLTGDRLATLNEFIADIKADMASFEQVSNEQKQRVESLFDQFASAIAAINEQKGAKPALINALAVEALDAFGYILYGYLWLLMADKALAATDALEPGFAEVKSQLKEFYFAKLLAKADFHLSQLAGGDDSVMALAPELF